GGVVRRRGYAVESRGDGPAALDAAASFHPDEAVLDLGLPGMDGWELARRLRQACGPGLVLIVAVTGYGDGESVRRSREAGIDRHLVKPVDPQGLLELLAGVRQGAGEGPDRPRPPPTPREATRPAGLPPHLPPSGARD